MDKINEAANNWNKTKNPKYKYLWYKLIKEWADGFNTIERWNVLSSRSNKRDDGRYKVIK